MMPPRSRRSTPPSPGATPPPPTYSRLLTGHYHGGSNYRAWRPQGTADWLLIWTAGGAGRFGLNGGGEAIVRPGDAILLAPGIAHDYGTYPPVGKWEIFWVHFLARPDWPADLLRGWPAEQVGTFRLQVAAPVRADIERCLAEAHKTALGPGERAAMRAQHGLEEVLLRLDATKPPARTVPVDERISRAAEILCVHLKHPPGWPELSRRVGLSPSRFAHLFSSRMGCPPARYLEEQRIRRARLLLENTGRSVAEIATEVGFADPFYFSNRFRRWAGVSPRGYRESLPSRTK